MRLAIVGAGATGGYLGACLARAGADVVLVARGPHLAAMRERGLTVREPDGSAFTTHPECTDDLGGAVGSAEAVLVTLKAHSLPGVAEALGTALRPGASVVFAQNGIPWWYAEGLETVDPGGAIAAHIPKEAVLGCVVYPATSLAEPGVVEHVEGKGVRGSEPCFLITAGEVDRARKDPGFFLAVVTSALSASPQVTKYSSSEFCRRFELFAIQYRAALQS